MQISQNQFSIVVLAENHNPTIINPDFCDRKSIVDPSWGWKLKGDQITTPPFAKVQYENGVTITVEFGKLQVTDPGGSKDNMSKIREIVIKYIKELPNINYKAVGINFRSVITNGIDSTYLKDKFLKEGPWDTKDSPLQAVGYKFNYDIDNGKIGLSIDSGTLSSDVGNTIEENPVIIIGANFHRGFEAGAYKEIISAIENSDRDVEKYDQLVESLDII
ncbi:MAG TPA: hypothetical protein VIM41_07095 [Gammaproteobacteria bacterium]